nr:PAS domain S-box protein [Methanosarcina sp. MTP4]
MTSKSLSEDELEVRVRERTAELEKANQALRAEILERKLAEEMWCRSEHQGRAKPGNVLSPAPEVTRLELADIIDAPAIQSLMDDFYKFSNISMALIDLKGNVLVGVGWRDICTRFHRIHPEARKHCIESDTQLSAGVSPGEFKLYRCKNNMWDLATPIMVGNQHVGNLFLGQFFFEDEPLDYELFRSQARKYGFDEEEYMAAFEKVPRLSRETVDTSMAFLTKLAHMISQLSYSNIMLARSLVERDALVDALQVSEKRCRMLFDHSMDALILSDPRDGGKILSANPAACRMLGWAEEELIGRGRDVMFNLEDPAVSDVLDELMRTGSTKAQLTYTRKDGTTFPGEISSAFFTDGNGEPRAVIIIRDITERKKVEEALRLSYIYNRNLIEANLDPLVTIGRDGKIKDVNSASEQITGCSRDELIGTDFSDYFTEPEKAGAGYQQAFINGEVRDYPLEIRHRDEHITPVLYNASVYKDENGKVIGVFAAARDITERKRAEHQLSNELARATGLYELYTRSSNLSDRELYDFALNQAIKITDSTIGFFHLVSEDEKEIILTTWNQEALRSCTAGKEGHYPIEKAGNWVDCARLKRPVVYNDFPSSPNQKGLPSGHVTVKRFMSVPVTENGKVKIILGVGNKVDEYDDRDVMQLQLVANELHKIMKLRRIENEVRESEAFLRDIMENVSDAIFVRDRDARMILANPAYYRLMGKSPEEVLNKTVADFHPPEMARKLAEDDKRVMETGKGTTLEERIFTSHGLRVLQTVKAPYYDGKGNIIGLIGAARDITERKKAEEALKRAHENLEGIVKVRTAELEKAYHSLKDSEKGLAEAQKMAHIGNWEWDIATDEAYWSEEMYRIFGRDPRELAPSYNEYLSYIHPDDRDYYCNATKKAVTGSPFGIDYRIFRDNGEVRTVHLESEFILNNKKIPVRIKGIVQDITERKKSEEKIQVLANIVKSSNDAIGTISLDDIITSCNEEVEQVYGYSAEELIGNHTSIVAPPHLDKETKKLSELIKQGKKIHHHETSRLRKDGQIIDVSITLSPVFDSHGKLTAISFISRDITERKRVEEKLRESEEKYRNIVETANEGIFIIDAESRVTYANEKMTDMLGYTLEEVIGIAIWDFVSEDCKAIVKLNLERRRQGINEIYELKLICKGGSSLWVLISAKSLFDMDGRFMGSISMLTDITKRKEAEEALSNIEIARKQEIHHRIKNNLQVISSLLDLEAEKFNNREDIKDSEVLEAFRESQDRVISMALIHEELYKGGGFDTLNFSSYIEKLVENLFQTYSLGNADLSLNMGLEENTFFDMDVAVPLGIIVNELVSNSLKHAFTEKEGEILIRFCREEKNKERDKSLFSLTISDNGKGIPESIGMERVESLGLQLVNILIDQLEGNIELKRNHGTEFRITFSVEESP